jgi:putative FmdB family regulatory protein
MPTYGYECTACEKAFELDQRITDDPATTCALCGKETAKRVIVSGNFILKGSGWYADGYSGSGGNKGGE